MSKYHVLTNTKNNMGGTITEIVQADKYQIHSSGVLEFLTSDRSGDTAVMVFAPGVWVKFEEKNAATANS